MDFSWSYPLLQERTQVTAPEVNSLDMMDMSDLQDSLIDAPFQSVIKNEVASTSKERAALGHDATAVHTFSIDFIAQVWQ